MSKGAQTGRPGGGKAQPISLALLAGARVILEVAGVCAVLCVSLVVGHTPVWAGVAGALGS